MTKQQFLAFGHQVLQWPEFQAFRIRLGIPEPHYVTKLTIVMPIDDVVKFSVETLGRDHADISDNQVYT